MSGTGPFYQPGTYVCRVVNQAWTESEKKKLPMLLLKVEPVFQAVKTTNAAGAVVEEFPPTQKAWTRTVRLVINTESESSVEFALMKLAHAGFVGSSLRDLQLEGKQIRCTCEWSEYQGRDVEQWDLELPPREDDVPDNDPAVVRRLDAVLGKKLKAAAKNEPAKAAKPPALEPGEDPLGGAFDPPPTDAKPAAAPVRGGWD